MQRFIFGAISTLCVLSLSAQQDTTERHDDSVATGLHIGRGNIRVGFDFLLPSQLDLLRLATGYSTPSIVGSPSLSPAAALEVDFGRLNTRRGNPEEGVYRLEGTSIAVTTLSPTLAFRNRTQVAVEGWRIGFRLSGGHRFSSDGRSGMYLLHSGGWTWSYIRSGSPSTDGDSAANAHAIADIAGYRTSHFGANTAATIGYSIGGLLTIEASYQRVLLYKNHVFFPWLGSLLLEGIAQSLLSTSLSAAEQRNPHAAAIATLILRSALSWGIYELRRTSGQHFPFGGNTPMLWDEFRIGIGIQF